MLQLHPQFLPQLPPKKELFKPSERESARREEGELGPRASLVTKQSIRVPVGVIFPKGRFDF